MSQYNIPHNDQWNYYIPLLFGECCTGDSTNHFSPAGTGNRVSSEEFKQFFAELKAAVAPNHSRRNCYIWIYILSVFLITPGIVVPIVCNAYAWLGVGITIPVLLSVFVLVRAINQDLKKRKVLAPILERHNMMTYHARGLHWALGQNLHYLHLSLYYGLPPGNYSQFTQAQQFPQQQFPQTQQFPQQPFQQQPTTANPYTAVQFNEPAYGNTTQKPLYPQLNQPLLNAKPNQF